MSQYPLQHEWLSLIEISGPFLAANVLNEAFPQGLEGLDAQKRKRLRQAYEEWREAVDNDDPQLSELHAAWIDEVLSRTLELDENNKGDVLKRSEWCSQQLSFTLPEQGITTAPNFAVVNEQQANKPLLLIQVYPQSVNLDLVLKQEGWAITPADKMVQLCRAQGCRLGLVTNGERWILVDAPIGATTSFASWYARIWNQEPVTLQAFVHLLGIRRFFVGDEEQLPALFDRSLKFQDEVTDALGEQVRRAVEVLIQALDKADQDHNRELLRNTSEPELYEAALTVMMRLVFLLSAEERGLLLMGDERYEANYALSTLRMQLRIEAPEILEQRLDAWSRLLAIFRAVYGGIDHENLRLPALGGSLFDPDRFPFLEGRAKGTAWRSDPAKPLPIDNRTVLLLLDAIQMFQGRSLSYRALDVEQIGYVYEGLLERTVKRTDDITLDLGCTKNAKNPLVKLAELHSAKLDGAEKLSEFLAERSGSSANRIRNDLNRSVDDALAERLLTACQGNTDLRNRVKPYAHLLRVDPWGYPLVYPKGAFIVTSGSDRRETGTHYTPKSLTESIVTETLTPIVYVGPSQGASRDQWVLKSPSELLELKICDPAMGSGAFLVQVCRWLSDRLVEAWAIAESVGDFITVDGVVLNTQEGYEFLPTDTESRVVIARRLIAERCLYGVDLNPLAVELAKLSIWLITLAKGRPFGFLDHNLICADSLLGITQLEQLYYLNINPTRLSDGGGVSKQLFAQKIQIAVEEAIVLRMKLRHHTLRDINDVEAMSFLDKQARTKLVLTKLISDALCCEIQREDSNQARMLTLSIEIGRSFDEENDLEWLKNLVGKTRLGKLMHWCIYFPEVFLEKDSGFDAVVGNPPWGGLVDEGKRRWIDSAFEYVGDYEFAMAFVELCTKLVKKNGHIGLILPNTILLNDSSKNLRDYLANNFSFERIIDLSDVDIFHGANVRCCAVNFSAEKPTNNLTVYQKSIVTDNPEAVPVLTLKERKHWSNLTKIQIQIPQGFPLIDDIFFVKQGYKPYDKHALIKRMSNADAEHIVKTKPWHASEKVDETYVRELKGKDLSHFSLEWSGNWASYGPWVSNYIEPSWFGGERVLVREIVAPQPRAIMAAKTNEFFVHNPSVILLKSKTLSIIHDFLEMYLNSSLGSQYISQISSKAAKGMFPKVLVKDLRQMPFPNIEVFTKELLAEMELIKKNFEECRDYKFIDDFVHYVFDLAKKIPFENEKNIDVNRTKKSKVNSSSENKHQTDLFGI